MTLQQELSLRKPIAFLAHEALLNIYHTASCLKKRGDEFFRPHNLTDVQFNVLELLGHQSGKLEGLSQAELSDMMLVNRANITSLVDRMEKAGLVSRTTAPSDRRSNIVKLTGKGKKLLSKVEPLYTREVKKIMSAVPDSQQKKLVKMLGDIRGKINR